MRIDLTSERSGGLHPTRGSADAASDARASRRTPTAAEGAGDDVTLSSRARLMAMAQKALDETPAVRQSVVDRARETLEGGSERWDGASVARAMVESIQGRAD